MVIMLKNGKRFSCAIAKVAFCIALAGALSSCAVVDWFMGKTSDEEVKEMDNEIAQSMTAKKTPYDEALRQFGMMLDAYNISEVRVQSKLISNQTAEKELPDDVSRMLISAVNKISKKVVYIPYDPSYVLNEANTGGDIARALPQIVLSGGITEFDKDLIEKGRELKAEASVQKGDYGSNYSHDGGAGYQAESGVSRITLDLQLLNYKTQTYLPGIQGINSVNIRKTKLGWGVGYFFQGSGMSFQYSLQQKQGKYQALRLLVELSVLEVMGKYFDIPYWKCIPGMPADNAMISRIREEFASLDDARQNFFIKEYAYFHGETAFDRQTSSMNASEMALLDQLMKKNNCADRADLFVKLWETVPVEDAIKRNKDYARELAKKAMAAREEAGEKASQYNALISHADTLFSSGRLDEAREAYRKANSIFPDQKDPVDMMVRIDKQMAAKNQQQAAPAANPPVVTMAAPQAQPADSAEKQNTGTKKKEAPLNPFKQVDW
ncbi:MAG: hypothetical protein A2020_04290 [Lentisphaerae bacterium GWF2_45_14]|nr:MAG: hypothetical protein A2020_04290 [Lentisphaerae bacterium GWF2_45_14]